MSTKKAWGLLKVLIINLVILATLLELASAGFYFLQTRQFFYTRKEKVPPAVGSIAGNVQNEAGAAFWRFMSKSISDAIVKDPKFQPSRP